MYPISVFFFLCFSFFLAQKYFFVLFNFLNGHIRNVIFTLIIDVNINVKIQKVDCRVFKVINFNVNKHNVASTLIFRCRTSWRHINLTATLKQYLNVCWVIISCCFFQFLIILFQICQISRCYREPTDFNRFFQVSRGVKFFFRYCLPSSSKQYLIRKPFHSLSKEHSVSHTK